jgi:hypothetical protein
VVLVLVEAFGRIGGQAGCLFAREAARGLLEGGMCLERERPGGGKNFQKKGKARAPRPAHSGFGKAESRIA